MMVAGVGGRISTSAPPIQIFHPIFDLFNRLVNSPDVQPTTRDFEQVFSAMQFASTVSQTEDEYSDKMRFKLGTIVGGNILRRAKP
jgi:hypothetical protein